jgi:hypothetical protein
MDATLTRPLVASSGNLDAFDALVTWRLLSDAAARALGDDGGRERLASEIAVAGCLVAPWWRGFASDDPLDLGEALWLAHWHCDAAALLAGGGRAPRDAAEAGAGRGGKPGPGVDLAAASGWVAAEALRALEGLFEGGYFDQPAQRRLAFREFGATLGVQVGACRLGGFWGGGSKHKGGSCRQIGGAAALVVCIAQADGAASASKIRCHIRTQKSPTPQTACQAVVSRAPELPGAKAWARRVASLHRFWGAPALLTARDRDISPIMYAASLLPRVWIRG